MARREQIAEAGVRLIARSGVRTLTHLLVDKEAGLPRGSTSYYARTRRDLTALVVERLSDDTQSDLDGLAIPPTLSHAQAVQVVVELLDHLAQREDAQAARYALLFELRNDDKLRALLTVDAPVREILVEQAEKLLQAVGVADPSRHATDLVGLLDALLMYRTAQAAPVDAARVIGAYLEGLRQSVRTARRRREGARPTRQGQ
ncbi:TetR/AcrR family transcriptional regulator [Kribbella sp. NPDC051586]|uniref:TetR/AcrR family transcriptional regulator n=1 Tax=Kribbella sp. NPDC051586 TaxID=3364118 RepID=UPI00379F4588